MCVCGYGRANVKFEKICRLIRGNGGASSNTIIVLINNINIAIGHTIIIYYIVI